MAGSLPSTVTIANTDVINEYTPGFTYGNMVTFDVTLSVPTVSGSAGSGSSFFFSLLDSGFTPLLASMSSPAGQLIEIDLDATGNPTIVNYSQTARRQSSSPRNRVRFR